MATIDQLNGASSLSAGDLLAVFSQTNGDARKASLSLLLTWLQGQMTASGGMSEQYAAPNATGFSVTINPPATGANVHLILTPAAGYAAGTIVLPSSPVHAQEVIVNSTQSVSTLTVSGGTVYGAPTSLSANGFFRVRYDGVASVWYRIG